VAKTEWKIEFYPKGSSEKVMFFVSAENETAARMFAKEGVRENGGGFAFNMEQM